MLRLLLYRIKYIGVANTALIVLVSFYHFFLNLTSCSFRKCRCCNRLSLFFSVHRGDESIRCGRCGANRRFEMLSTVIQGRWGKNLDKMDVLELDPESPLRRLLSHSRTYIRTYYSDKAAFGSCRNDGARCEDITQLTISDNSIDLIVSSDVLEHVSDIAAAFKESYRILRNGGAHIFTVPMSAVSAQRAMLQGGHIIHLLPEVRHLDPINPNGSLVFWDFGPNFPEQFDTGGLTISVAAGPEGPDKRLVWVAVK